MAYITKRQKEIKKLIGDKTSFSIAEAVDLVKKSPSVKFDQTIELSLKMGVDPRKADQQVRATVALPSGSGKKLKILVFAKGEEAAKAKEAGADFIGDKELLEKVNSGWTDFDVVCSTPEMMREVGKLGKVLGPRGLMPSPKAGTVTKDVAKAVKELLLGKIEFKVDKNSSINVIAGKLSFTKEEILKNIKEILKAIFRAKPSGVKGAYIKSFSLSSTMGPGFRIDLNSVDNFVG